MVVYREPCTGVNSQKGFYFLSLTSNSFSRPFKTSISFLAEPSSSASLELSFTAKETTKKNEGSILH